MLSHVPRRRCVQAASKVGEVHGEDGTARESSRALIGQVSIARGIHRHAVPDDNIEKERCAMSAHPVGSRRTGRKRWHSVPVSPAS
jgi:hypothetical protein